MPSRRCRRRRGENGCRFAEGNDFPEQNDSGVPEAERIEQGCPKWASFFCAVFQWVKTIPRARLKHTHRKRGVNSTDTPLSLARGHLFSNCHTVTTVTQPSSALPPTPFPPPSASFFTSIPLFFTSVRPLFLVRPHQPSRPSDFQLTSVRFPAHVRPISSSRPHVFCLTSARSARRRRLQPPPQLPAAAAGAISPGIQRQGQKCVFHRKGGMMVS